MYDSLIAAAKDAIISIDEAQNIVLFNPAAEAIFRCSAREALGQPLDRFIPAAVRAVHRRHIENFGAQHGATHDMGGGARILKGVRTDGEVFLIDASISKSELSEGKLFTVILRDVTQREQDRAARQRYADLVECGGKVFVTTVESKVIKHRGLLQWCDGVRVRRLHGFLRALRAVANNMKVRQVNRTCSPDGAMPLLRGGNSQCITQAESVLDPDQTRR